MQNTKKEARAVTLKMLGLISPVALLKGIRQLKGLHVTGNEDFIEKKLVDSGGQAVYPNQPFKHGYKKVYVNKEQLTKKPISFRSPLTDKQLNIVAKFVGLAALKQCDTDTKYLRVLKSLLVQRCNVQNPDELNWNDILTHIGISLSKTEDREEIPPPSIEKAYRSYGYAKSQNPQLADAKDKEVYSWLAENGTDDYSLPAFETWQRYLRAGRKHYGTSKNTPRAGRTPKTAISVTDPAVRQITSKFDNQNEPD